MSRVLSQISIDNYLGTVKPKLTEHEAIVLERLEEIQPATAEMVANSLSWGIQSVSGRFTGLKRKRKIVLHRKGLNERGRTCAYYMPANALLEYGDEA